MTSPSAGPAPNPETAGEMAGRLTPTEYGPSAEQLWDPEARLREWDPTDIIAADMVGMAATAIYHTAGQSVRTDSLAMPAVAAKGLWDIRQPQAVSGLKDPYDRDLHTRLSQEAHHILEAAKARGSFVAGEHARYRDVLGRLFRQSLHPGNDQSKRLSALLVQQLAQSNYFTPETVRLAGLDQDTDPSSARGDIEIQKVTHVYAVAGGILRPTPVTLSDTEAVIAAVPYVKPSPRLSAFMLERDEVGSPDPVEKIPEPATPISVMQEIGHDLLHRLDAVQKASGHRGLNKPKPVNDIIASEHSLKQYAQRFDGFSPDQVRDALIDLLPAEWLSAYIRHKVYASLSLATIGLGSNPADHPKQDKSNAVRADAAVSGASKDDLLKMLARVGSDLHALDLGRLYLGLAEGIARERMQPLTSPQELGRLMLIEVPYDYPADARRGRQAATAARQEQISGLSAIAAEIIKASDRAPLMPEGSTDRWHSLALTGIENLIRVLVQEKTKNDERPIRPQLVRSTRTRRGFLRLRT